MELSQDEKDRIIAEEKLRMDTRRDYLKDQFGERGWHGRHMGGCWHGHGCCGRGWGFLRALVVILLLAAAFHCWRGDFFRGPCGYYPPPAQYQAPSAPQAPGKN